jgi:hypothetical protein
MKSEREQTLKSALASFSLLGVVRAAIEALPGSEAWCPEGQLN